jgi:hypothetical protein
MQIPVMRPDELAALEAELREKQPGLCWITVLGADLIVHRPVLEVVDEHKKIRREYQWRVTRDQAKSLVDVGATWSADPNLCP